MSDSAVRDRTLAVIVLYKTKPHDSIAFRSLMESIQLLGPGSRNVTVLLFDNTPGAEPCADRAGNVRYHASPNNEGVAGAYAYALGLAQAEGFTWLLTLDQDTHLPPEFLLKIGAAAVRLQKDQGVSAIVPQLSHAGRLLSPLRMRPWGVSYLKPGIQGFPKGEIHAINSASLFRVHALAAMGGFDLRFWLDFQDHYIFLRLHRLGMRVWVAGDVQVEHDLSLISDQQSLGPERYRNFLLAESAFCDLYGGRVGHWALSGRLAARLWRQRKHGAAAAIQELTIGALGRRLFRSRMQRIREWEGEVERRFS